MAINQALKTYKQTDNDYVKGIETPHGRIQLLYETIIDNIDNLLDKHPKTNFVAMGKCINALNILAASLDMEKGKDLSQKLSDLYSYCSRNITEYLEDKKETKLIEVSEIISGLLEAWKEIDTK